MISYKSLMPALLLATLLVGCQNEELDNGLGTSDNLRVQATLGDSSSLRSNVMGSDVVLGQSIQRLADALVVGECHDCSC